MWFGGGQPLALFFRACLWRPFAAHPRQAVRRNQSRWLSLAAAAPPHPCQGREEQDVVILGKRFHPAPPTQHGSAIAAPEIRPP